MKMLKPVTVDFDLLVQSMRDLCRASADYFFNKNSGKVVGLPRNLIRFLETGDRGMEERLPSWESGLIPEGREIVLDNSPSYIRIPEAFGRPERRWMVEFAKEIKSPKLRIKFLQALQGRGCCGRFKDLLKEAPEDLGRWKNFVMEKWQEKVRAWLESQGVLGVESKPKKSAPLAK